MLQVQEISQWLLHHDAEKKAYDGFWLNIENYRKEDPNEFEKYFGNDELRKIELRIESVAINFSNNYPDFNYNHVIITIQIKYERKEIGYYKLLLNFDGVPDDDYFVLY